MSANILQSVAFELKNIINHLGKNKSLKLQKLFLYLNSVCNSTNSFSFVIIIVIMLTDLLL